MGEPDAPDCYYERNLLPLTICCCRSSVGVAEIIVIITVISNVNVDNR